MISITCSICLILSLDIPIYTSIGLEISLTGRTRVIFLFFLNRLKSHIRIQLRVHTYFHIAMSFTLFL